nr:cellulase family glycosylhydrolase [Gemmatimonadota bacterium]
DEEHGDGLWYSQQYPEEAWIADWKTMVARYRNQPAVVAAELRNELRPDPAITDAKPSWGDGNIATDWNARHSWVAMRCWPPTPCCW